MRLVKWSFAAALQCEHLRQYALERHYVAASAVAGIKTTTAFPVIAVQTQVVGAMLASEVCLQASDIDALRLMFVSLCFFYLPNQA